MQNWFLVHFLHSQGIYKSFFLSMYSDAPLDHLCGQSFSLQNLHMFSQARILASLLRSGFRLVLPSPQDLPWRFFLMCSKSIPNLKWRLLTLEVKGHSGFRGTAVVLLPEGMPLSVVHSLLPLVLSVAFWNCISAFEPGQLPTPPFGLNPARSCSSLPPY
uniref:Uncharacterized protein n=1 Tax=Sphaerodactylus townsendi TaxID=933632 RepID=A0ACB8EFY6_9SAUR